MPARHSWLRRALICAVAAPSILTFTGPTASATERATTTLTISPGTVTKVLGQRATFTWTLSSGTARLASQPVRVYTRAASATTWTYHSTRATTSVGTVSLTFTVGGTPEGHARLKGTTKYASSWRSGLVKAVAPIGQRAVTEASRHQGAPYQYGAVGPTRFDCSGFTRYVWSRFGKTLPHNSGQQYGVVRHVSQSAKQVGDLVFMYSRGGIYHVGIYAGNGYMWDAPHSGDVVRKRPIWTSSYYVGRVA